VGAAAFATGLALGALSGGCSGLGAEVHASNASANNEMGARSLVHSIRDSAKRTTLHRNRLASPAGDRRAAT
jgi:hypothetical protein